MKIRFDNRDEETSTQIALKEIKKIGARVYEFSSKFQQKAIESFFTSLEKHLNPIEKIKLIADLIPIVFLHSEEKEVELFFYKTKEILSDPHIRNLPNLGSNSRYFFKQDYLDMQENFYKGLQSSFREKLINHQKESHNLKKENIPYPLNSARLISQVAQIKNLSITESIPTLIDRLKKLFKLEEFEDQPEDENTTDYDRLDNLAYLKKILSEIALDGDPDHLEIFLYYINQYLTDKMLLEDIGKENLDYIQAIFVSSLSFKDKDQIDYRSAKPQGFRGGFNLYFALLFRKLEKTLAALQKDTDDKKLEKDFNFYTSKIYELIFVLKKENLLKTFKNNLINTQAAFNFIPIGNNTNKINAYNQKMDNFIDPYLEKPNQPPKIDLPLKTEAGLETPQNVLNLFQVGKFYQDKFEKYKNAA
jgi:hypothetical protein